MSEGVSVAGCLKTRCYLSSIPPARRLVDALMPDVGRGGAAAAVVSVVYRAGAVSKSPVGTGWVATNENMLSF